MSSAVAGVVTGVDRLTKMLTTGLWFVGSVWLSVITVLVALDAVRRAAGATPIEGVPAFAALSVVAISFLAIPYATRRGVVIATHVAYDRFAPLARHVIDIGSRMLGALLFGLLVWSSMGPVSRSWQTREFVAEGSVRIPVYPVRILVLVAAVAMLLECSVAIARLVVSVPQGQQVSEPAGKSRNP